MDPISLYDFSKTHDSVFQNTALERITQIIKENSFVEGEYNDKFEQKFATMQGAKHALLVGNGTDALEISLKALDIGPGDKVGLPGITFYATAEAILNLGAIPVHIDVLKDSGLMDPKSLERMCQIHKLKAIIPVHIYGLPAPMESLEAIAQEHDISIVEDAAQACGTILPSGPVGSGSNLVTFSFYPTKNLSAFGDAGAILTQDDDLALKIKRIRNHGRGGDDLGRNSRCDHIQAAVLDLKLKKIQEHNQRRKDVALKYHQQLGPISGLMSEKYLKTSSWHLYPIRLKDRSQRLRLQTYLQEKKISTAPFYEQAMSKLKALEKFPGEDKVAKNLAGRILCLPLFPYLNDQQISYIRDNVKAFVEYERTSL
jgi:dTDP-4-amino-4,6-dideoxygalactose transaminase